LKAMIITIITVVLVNETKKYCPRLEHRNRVFQLRLCRIHRAYATSGKSPFLNGRFLPHGQRMHSDNTTTVLAEARHSGCLRGRAMARMPIDASGRLPASLMDAAIAAGEKRDGFREISNRWLPTAAITVTVGPTQKRG
jgi:hypothetical protein